MIQCRNEGQVGSVLNVGRVGIIVPFTIPHEGASKIQDLWKN